MALQPKPVYIPCLDAPGKVWRVDYYKPQGQPGYFMACEGELKEGPYGSSFTTVWPGSRALRKRLEGRASKPRLQALYQELLAEMRAKGLIPQKQEVAA